jgi:PAS domain S-box-containing protein
MSLEAEAPDAAAVESGSEAGEREFRELADHAPMMIWRARPDRSHDWFNRGWLNFTGRELGQEAGCGWGDRVHPDDLDQMLEIYDAAFEARRPFTRQFRLRRHDGAHRWVLDSAAPFFRSGEFAGFYGSCIDVTEMREAQAQEEMLLAELNHRVKNNLQLIISFLAHSAARAPSREAKELLDAAASRAHGVGAVQDQLYRHAAGMIDLAEYLPTLARTVLDSESEGGAALRIEVEPIPATIQQASNLGLIVNELMTNAVKHGAAARGTVSLGLRRLDAGRAELVISDDGPGFSAQVLTHAGPLAHRGGGLVDALAKRARAHLVRSNAAGAQVRLTFPIGD